MLVPQFEDLLKRTIGLEAASVGSSTIARAVKSRMSAGNLTDSQAYWERIHSSPMELQALIEAVVIPETWFFRDREAFGAMVRVAKEEWLANRAQGVLRLLSLPCSTGEEPYSLAMALLDADFPAERFRIDAVDVNASALAHAERGTYGKNSFRGTELGYRDRHFVPAAQGHQLADSVRRHVRFRQGNLFDIDLLLGAQLYDIIFCRNVLIYFDTATQQRAIDLLRRRLTAKGCIFVGPSEASLLLGSEFISAKVPMAFGFRKATTAQREATRDLSGPIKQRCAAPRIGVSRLQPALAPVAEPRLTLRSAQATNSPPSIDEIRLIADRGYLAEAGLHCERRLRDGEASPEVLHLLGLIRDATGNRHEAAEYYRKTLYLDPNHQEALVHLALLLDKQGDTAGAKTLNDRAQRVERRERR
jgi:chemotaxis protein methyltransferase WspC